MLEKLHVGQFRKMRARMKSIPLMSLALISLLFGGTAGMANASFDACVKKLCVSDTQPDCWIKAGAELCNKKQSGCKELEDHTAAKVESKSGKWWQVQTAKGNGWVNERFMMIDGGMCE